MATNDESRVRTSVILPQEIHDQLLTLAQENDASVAWVIRKAVTEFLSKNKQK